MSGVFCLGDLCPRTDVSTLHRCKLFEVQSQQPTTENRKQLREKQWFSMLSSALEHDRKIFRTRKAAQCSNAFLSARNNPGVY